MLKSLHCHNFIHIANRRAPWAQYLYEGPYYTTLHKENPLKPILLRPQDESSRISTSPTFCSLHLSPSQVLPPALWTPLFQALASLETISGRMLKTEEHRPWRSILCFHSCLFRVLAWPWVGCRIPLNVDSLLAKQEHWYLLIVLWELTLLYSSINVYHYHFYDYYLSSF
jgi:hypothetical protein